MSRTAALWSAAALTLVFALVLGAVLLRPVLTANADDGGASPISILSGFGNDDDHEEGEYEEYDDDYDDYEDDEDDQDGEWDDDDHEEDNDDDEDDDD